MNRRVSRRIANMQTKKVVIESDDDDGSSFAESEFSGEESDASIAKESKTGSNNNELDLINQEDELLASMTHSRESTANLVNHNDENSNELDVENNVEEPAPVETKKKRVRKPKAPKIQMSDIHPRLEGIWERLKTEKLFEIDDICQPSDILCNLLPFQRQGLSWLQKQEECTYKGGILADEMGMGKTVQMISLLVSKLNSRPNLILCPTIALMQWHSELLTKTTPGLLKVIIFHGSKRETDIEVLKKSDVILTTYAILEQGFRAEHVGLKRKGVLVKKPSILHSIEWGRVILDEAHAIKDRYCATARATFKLKSEYKWSLSGTPMQNRIGELFSLIRFMNMYPYSYYFCTRCPCESQTWSFSNYKTCDQCGHTGHQHFNWWNREVLKPIQRYGSEGPGLEAFQKLGLILDRIMLRRTKAERNDELGLPPRVVECRRDVFNAAEEELYESLYTDTQRSFQTYANSGTVLNNYASIFSLLSRMRLAANHPDLVTCKIAPGNIKYVCCICHEEAEDPITSKCKHVFCREDARQYIESMPVGDEIKCPQCMRDLSLDLTQESVPSNDNNQVHKSIVNYLNLEKWRSSTKIEALVEELTNLKSEDATIKSIVFSQFVSFLDLIHWRLSRAGFHVLKLDGRMGPQQRAAVIDKFSFDPSITVFLISLKAGGIALNLTEASRVFVMDPWWNPAVEDQAMDRIHRLGQYRPIKITRMVIENSIESRIIELQEKKKAMFDSTVGKDMSSLARLTEDDFRFLFVL